MQFTDVCEIHSLCMSSICPLICLYITFVFAKFIAQSGSHVFLWLDLEKNISVIKYAQGHVL